MAKTDDIIYSVKNQLTSAGYTDDSRLDPDLLLHLANDIDVSRGDSIVKTNDIPKTSNELEVLLCWLDDKPLQIGNKYLLQHNSRLVRAAIKNIEYKLDVNSLQQQPVEGAVKLNEVVKATIKTAAPLVVDSFETLSTNGNAILIDETSNGTVAAVLIKS